jgi:hypothetical protein
MARDVPAKMKAVRIDFHGEQSVEEKELIGR